MKYIYFRNENNNSVACVGYLVDGKNITMGFAFCSPNDNFSKKTAHIIINGRIAKGKSIVFKDKEENPQYESIAKYAKNCLDGKGEVVGEVNIPNWFTGV